MSPPQNFVRKPSFSWFLVYTTTLILLSQLRASGALPCETGWTAYKDEKCLKLIDQFVTHADAQALCLSQVGGEAGQTSLTAVNDDDDNIPPLLTIKTGEEQDWATKFIFQDSEIVDNVWLGAKRSGVDQPFLWPDGSLLSYTNWHEGYPSQVEGNECTQIVPKGALQKMNQSDDAAATTTTTTKDTVDGKWTDISCTRRNLVVCQKLQTWSLQKLQRISLETTKALLDLRANPVPIGFIYVQLPRQPVPNETWPNVEWDDVTGDYAGLFFRAEGGQSAEFGSDQDQSTRRITSVEYGEWTSQPIPPWSIKLPETGWSDKIYAGVFNSVSRRETFRFEVSSAETRPVNTAVRIWKRVA